MRDAVSTGAFLSAALTVGSELLVDEASAPAPPPVFDTGVALAPVLVLLDVAVGGCAYSTPNRVSNAKTTTVIVGKNCVTGFGRINLTTNLGLHQIKLHQNDRTSTIEIDGSQVHFNSPLSPHLRPHGRDHIRIGTPLGGPYLRAQISARAPLATIVSTPRASRTCLKIRFRRLLSAA